MTVETLESLKSISLMDSTLYQNTSVKSSRKVTRKIRVYTTASYRNIKRIDSYKNTVLSAMNSLKGIKIFICILNSVNRKHYFKKCK